MTDYSANIVIANYNADTTLDSLSNDVIIYTQQKSQNLLITAGSNSGLSAIRVNSNNTLFNTTVTLSNNGVPVKLSGSNNNLLLNGGSLTASNINFTGSLLQSGLPYIGSQWSNITNGITYNSNVIIGSNIAVIGAIYTDSNFLHPYIGSQWTTVRDPNFATASNIFISSNVGIGSSNTFSNALYVAGDMACTGTIKIVNPVSYTKVRISQPNTNTGATMFMSIAGLSNEPGGTDIAYSNNNAGYVRFTSGTSELGRMTASNAILSGNLVTPSNITTCNISVLGGIYTDVAMLHPYVGSQWTTVRDPNYATASNIFISSNVGIGSSNTFSNALYVAGDMACTGTIKIVNPIQYTKIRVAQPNTNIGATMLMSIAGLSNEPGGVDVAYSNNNTGYVRFTSGTKELARMTASNAILSGNLVTPSNMTTSNICVTGGIYTDTAFSQKYIGSQWSNVAAGLSYYGGTVSACNIVASNINASSNITVPYLIVSSLTTSNITPATTAGYCNLPIDSTIATPYINASTTSIPSCGNLSNVYNSLSNIAYTASNVASNAYYKTGSTQWTGTMGGPISYYGGSVSACNIVAATSAGYCNLPIDSTIATPYINASSTSIPSCGNLSNVYNSLSNVAYTASNAASNAYFSVSSQWTGNVGSPLSYYGGTVSACNISARSNITVPYLVASNLIASNITPATTAGYCNLPIDSTLAIPYINTSSTSIPSCGNLSNVYNSLSNIAYAFNNSVIVSYPLGTFPPTDMTADTCILNGQSYTSLASSFSGSQNAYKAFGNYIAWPYVWIASGPTLNAYPTQVNNIGSYGGEWVQVKLPIAIMMGTLMMCGTSAAWGPVTWILVGCNDWNGTSTSLGWTQIGVQQTSGSWGPTPRQTFTFNSTTAYSTYRICVSTGGTSGLAISNIIFTGNPTMLTSNIVASNITAATVTTANVLPANGNNSGTIGNNGTAFGNMYSQNIYSQNGTVQISDSILKEFVSLEYGLSNLIQVETIKYKWKDQADLEDDDPKKGYEYYGVKADQLVDIFPELIYTENSTHQINYSELIPVCINAIKELKSLIDAQSMR